MSRGSYFLLFILTVYTPILPRCKQQDVRVKPHSSTWLQLPDYHASFYEELAERIWHNESGRSVQKLVWWNDGESFMSLGIGHFLWFPTGRPAPFTQTFPDMLTFMQQKGQQLPTWLGATKSSCPWTDRNQVINNTHDLQLQELRDFLQSTITLQADFIAHRFEESCLLLVDSVPARQRSLLKKRIGTLASTPQGLYALIDYVNFKGDGTNKQERYLNKGWGLLQVISLIDAAAFDKNPRAAFVAAAEKVLKQRVEHAPPARHEERWLAGWINRIHTYL
ncbi:hypothetical protein JST99_02115 [Candidatus Dependentiae bacterium]|nr:hypothetical protein [Candidatus Dependentiae bacterium]MCC7415355.1 hypothetical protein [Campylobacterota bacterium]